MGKIEGATPEQVAQAIFAAAKTPDPTKRKPRGRRRVSHAQDEVEDEISYMKRPPKPENTD